MGVADLLKFSFSLPTNHPTGGGGKKNAFLRWRSSASQPKKPFQWTRICGFMLFALGLMSLLTGHIVSHLDWYSQRLGKRSFPDMSGQEPIDLWKSKYSNFFYGCSGRGKNFPPAIRERSSNGYLLIAASGGLNQQRTGVLQLTKFDYRVANELQKLRCRVNYHALRFTKPIQSLGMKVVKRMRKMAKRFGAVHLRM